MVKKLNKTEFASLQTNGALQLKEKPKPVSKPVQKTEVKKKDAFSKHTTNKSSTEAKAAAAAAQQAAQAAKQSLETINTNNKILKSEVIEIVEGRTNRIVKLVVNRGSNELITDLDIIREQDSTVINKRDLN